MELQIDKKIRQYRKQMDITQGELARILGVSPQSVSKWETGEGYPDITLLPKIANYFNVSIDLLLGNDKAPREEDLQKFFRTIREELPQHADEERLRLGLEYAEKYPENDAVAHELCWIIAWQSDKKKREEYLPVLKEQCEKIIRLSTEQAYRDSAVELMCSYGTDEEYEKWSAMCPGDYSSVRNEILEKRLLSAEHLQHASPNTVLRHLVRVAQYSAAPREISNIYVITSMPRASFMARVNLPLSLSTIRSPAAA